MTHLGENPGNGVKQGWGPLCIPTQGPRELDICTSDPKVWGPDGTGAFIPENFTSQLFISLFCQEGVQRAGEKTGKRTLHSELEVGTQVRHHDHDGKS